MRSVNPTVANILLMMGVLVLIVGIQKIVKYIIFVNKPHVTVRGEIIGCDREVRRYKLYSKTICHVKLKFEYEGRTYNVNDENPISEKVYDELYHDSLECGIRITENSPHCAVLECTEALAAPRNEGIRFILVAIAVIILSLI